MGCWCDGDCAELELWSHRSFEACDLTDGISRQNVFQFLQRKNPIETSYTKTSPKGNPCAGGSLQTSALGVYSS